MNRRKTMNKLKTTLTALFFTGLMTSTAIAGQDNIDRVELAASSLNFKDLQQLSTELQGYDAALANYRLALTANLTERSDDAEVALDKAMEILEQLQQEQAGSAEVNALLAQVYGYKIALSPIKGLIYGAKSHNTLEKAKEIAPNNPRVLLVTGIGAVNTPPMFGGSTEAAMNAFDKAVVAYENDRYSDYYWGHAEAYTWRGMLHSQQGEHEKAMADWQKALDIEPGYGWAKSLVAQHSN